MRLNGFVAFCLLSTTLIWLAESYTNTCDYHWIKAIAKWQLYCSTWMTKHLHSSSVSCLPGFWAEAQRPDHYVFAGSIDRLDWAMRQHAYGHSPHFSPHWLRRCAGLRVHSPYFDYMRAWKVFILIKVNICFPLLYTRIINYRYVQISVCHVCIFHGTLSLANHLLNPRPLYRRLIEHL